MDVTAQIKQDINRLQGELSMTTDPEMFDCLGLEITALQKKLSLEQAAAKRAVVEQAAAKREQRIADREAGIQSVEALLKKVAVADKGALEALNTFVQCLDTWQALTHEVLITTKDINSEGAALGLPVYVHAKSTDFCGMEIQNDLRLGIKEVVERFGDHFSQAKRRLEEEDNTATPKITLQQMQSPYFKPDASAK